MGCDNFFVWVLKLELGLLFGDVVRNLLILVWRLFIDFVGMLV